MRHFYFLKFLVIAFLLVNNGGLNAQSIIEENLQIMPGSSVKYKHNFNYKDYTKLLDENVRKVYTLNHLAGQNDTPVGEKDVNDVTLNINLVFDPGQYAAPQVVIVYDETGYMNFAYWGGSNPITINVPPGNYDILADFSSGATSHIVIKELVAVQQETTIEVNVDEADNHITTAFYNEAGEPLEPPVYDSITGNVSGGNALSTADRIVLFAPVNASISSYSYTWGVSYSEGEEPIWNFYISDVSDRYSIIQTIFGLGYEGVNYFTKYETLSGVSDSVNLENNPEDWVYHQEKFQPSPLGEDAGVVYPGFSTLIAFEGFGYNGWTVYITGGDGIDPEEGFKAYLSNTFDENPTDLLVFPAIVDYLGIIDPSWPFVEGFLITGNAIVAGVNNETIYGSGNMYFSMYFLGNMYYQSDPRLKVLPFHPQFSFTSTDNPDIKLGNNSPIAVTAVAGDWLTEQYKGRYGETRESDFFNTNVEIKQNDNVVFSGSYTDFVSNYFYLSGSGHFEATFTNLNIEVDGLAGKNITQLIFDRNGEDSIPPTMQMLQFRDTTGKVTDRFTSASEGIVRLAAGDFKYIPESYRFEYNEGNTIKLYYSQYDQNDWIELELTEYPEHFFMPAFGDYYEASLAGIANTENDVWYDVKIVCTDTVGNSQTQTVSPAFKLNNTLTGTETNGFSELPIYPNPFSDHLQIQLPESIKGRYTFKVADLSGKTVYFENRNSEQSKSYVWDGSKLPKGIYICIIISDNQVMVRKLIKK